MLQQQWALIRRTGIVFCRTPVRSFIRIFVWPGFLLGLLYYLISSIPSGDSGSNDYVRLGFVKMSATILPFLVFFHMYASAEYLIVDKAKRMKSLMISMGLKRIDYYCAMSSCFHLLILPIVIVYAVLMKYYLLDDTVGMIVILTLHLLFVLHLESFLSTLVSLISSPSYTFVIAVVLFFENLLQDLAVLVLQHAPSSHWKPLVLFLISVSPFQPLRFFINGYISKHPEGGVIDTSVKPSQDMIVIHLEQLFWIIALKLFAVWFEEVSPWQNFSARRSPLYCFDRRDDRFQSADDSDVHEQTGEYFERWVSRNRQAGIKIYSVSKSFGNVPAVSDLSLVIYKGETTFLLGHNGAGKSTLINMILGTLIPDQGRVNISVSNSARRGSIGVCPQNSILDDNLTVRQHLDLFACIKSDMVGLYRQQHIDRTLEDMSLMEHENKRPNELSGGMRRKLSLGMAFVGESDVLLLDEPSSGLDPDSRMFIWDVIRRYRADRTVLLSTQHMEEADYLGDRIAIMSSGRLICCGSSVFLKNKFGTCYKLRVECQPGKKANIVAHIKRYFESANLISDTEIGSTDIHDNTEGDFVIELKKSGGDSESAMIKLFEDLENNHETLGVRSYGLKSSSIEDVMLYTSKYFAQSSKEDGSTRLTVAASENHLNILARSKHQTRHETRSQFYLRILTALIMKQLQVYRANWFTVLVLKFGTPSIAAYRLSHDLSHGLKFETLWQSPVTALLVAHLIYFPTRERISKFKIMQLESDATISLFWLGQIIVDIVVIIINILIVNLFVFYLANISIKIGYAEFYLLLTSATFMFSVASMAFLYLLSTILTDARTSYGSVTLIFGTSLIAYTMISIIRMAIFHGDQIIIQDIFNYIGILFLPGDAFRIILVGFQKNCYYLTVFDSTCPSSGSGEPSFILIGFVALALQVGAYGFLLTLVETQRINLSWYLTLSNWLCCFKSPKNLEFTVSQMDEDVLHESNRAQNSLAEPNNRSICLVASNIEKSYTVGKKIIHNLSFCINKGECFGLLGVNGAGKTTTFSMLVGESKPDRGEILACSHRIERAPESYRRMFGYDPQSDPDFSLTPTQALGLMARLRGVNPSNIPILVGTILDLLNMTEHASKLDSQLSGGTKRKLTLGMALIGNPTILALDEPTAGVDPLARRGVWRLLKSLRKQNEASIVISSHAMEECEAICDRISIMARGRLRCIGTFLHLRSKFARGCSLRVQFIHQDEDLSQSGRSIMNDDIISELTTRLSDTIGSTTFRMSDRNINSVTFEIIDNRIRRSLLFRVMREFKQKQARLNYMINDSSLEDIFVSLAKEQQEADRLTTRGPSQS